jgi:hypothetical protein
METVNIAGSALKGGGSLCETRMLNENHVQNDTILFLFGRAMAVPHLGLIFG